MDSDDDEEEGGGEAKHESENEYVQIPVPTPEPRSPASGVPDTLAVPQHQYGVAHGTQHAAVNRLRERSPTPTPKTPTTPESPALHDEPESMLGSSDEQEEEVPKMPGSFDLSGPPIRRPGGATPSPLSSAPVSPLSPSSWMEMIKNLAI